MPYITTSTTFRIPYWPQDAQSSGVSNERAADIIDTQLRGASRLLGGDGILEEGSYSAVFATGDSTVSLEDTAENYALEAIIAGEYVAQNETLQWTTLPNNQTIYLYVQALETNLYQDNEKSTLAQGKGYTTYNLTGLTPTDSIFVGIATTTGSAITLNTGDGAADLGTYTTGKPYVYPYRIHRTQAIIDHPDGSVVRGKLGEYCVLTPNVHPWDGITSGTSLSGTGIGTTQIKAKAITLDKLADEVLFFPLTLSGLTSTISGLQVQISGLTTTVNSHTVSINLLSGVSDNLVSQVSGLNNRVSNNSIAISVLSGVSDTLVGQFNGIPTYLSGLTNTVSNNSIAIATLSGVSDNLKSQVSGLDYRIQRLTDDEEITTSGTGNFNVGVRAPNIQYTSCITVLGGSGTHVCNFVLPITPIVKGTLVRFFFEVEASANPYLSIRNATSVGTILRNLSGNPYGHQYVPVDALYNGNRWRIVSI